LCCAWIGDLLVDAGYEPADERTVELIERWRGADASAIAMSKSVTYLRDTGQLADLDFILARIDDLDAVFALDAEEIVRLDGN
jgi:hypothetical protein